ncbi:MAG: argininosuccinate lyase [Candidatus Neomarinimicrobiota bacterium]
MAKKLWGGRFTKPIDPEFEQFSQSIHYDIVLAEYDILHSILHVKALNKAELLSNEETNQLLEALYILMQEVKNNEFTPDPQEEDIHSAVQNILEKRIGKLALKLHTLRSRNDQIAFDVKAYSFSSALKLWEALTELVKAFLVLAKKTKGLPYIGYTHTQRAQIIQFSDYSKAYAIMFDRDRERLEDYLKHTKVRIGAGALAGSSIPHQAYTDAIHEEDPRDALKMRVVENSLEHVADRDFVIELLSHASLIQMHLSRFAEDMILYTTAEFDYIDLPEEFCTGSSLMPHKKNADLMELLRGHSGTIYGNLMALLVTMKGLPLTYNRDMQLDKEPLFRSIDIILSELDQVSRMVPGIELKSNKINKALEDEHLYGVEIAEFLVNKGMAFKDAHNVVGKLVRYSEDNNVLIKEIPNEKLQEFHPALNSASLKSIMTPEYAIKQKKSIRR